MTLPGTAADVLQDHVLLEVERIDRMYLNVYQPSLQLAAGVVQLLRSHRGHPIASSTLLDPISKAFAADIRRLRRRQRLGHHQLRARSTQRRRCRQSAGRLRWHRRRLPDRSGPGNELGCSAPRSPTTGDRGWPGACLSGAVMCDLGALSRISPSRNARACRQPFTVPSSSTASLGLSSMRGRQQVRPRPYGTTASHGSASSAQRPSRDHTLPRA